MSDSNSKITVHFLHASSIVFQQRAREIINWRQEQKQQQKIDQDDILIKRKIEEHQADYAEKREQNLSRGIRRGSIYSRERSKEIKEGDHGPELAIVVKGERSCIHVDHSSGNNTGINKPVQNEQRDERNLKHLPNE